jgi:predicted negative regulator of RcsB-dependent stress response
MGVYDLEEQEKIDDLKAWWNRWGNTITFAVVAACVVIGGVQAWRWWQSSRAAEASVLYQAVSEAARKNDPAKGKDAVTQLADRFAGTSYAPRAALVYAKTLFDAGDKAGAKAQLAWVIENADEEELKAIARFRAAEILLDEKQYDEALKTLDAKHPESFNALYADLRGDALMGAGRTADARAAYQEALAAFDPKSGYRAYVQVKLDAAGGAAAPVSSGSAAPASPAAAPPQGGAVKK